MSEALATIWGSPPHMRGKVSSCSSDSRHLRITPAHAGKRNHTFHDLRKQKDHPRTCGEKRKRFSDSVCGYGSPPHMWGKETLWWFIRLESRITPAHAGKSIIFFSLKCVFGDHPRTCGEKMPMSEALATIWGSPPHMRGKDTITADLQGADGITPAHAGKSSHSYSSNSAIRDHPRTCGEKWIFHISFFQALGSPPHMRGKVPIHTLQIVQ